MIFTLPHVFLLTFHVCVCWSFLLLVVCAKWSPPDSHAAEDDDSLEGKLSNNRLTSPLCEKVKEKLQKKREAVSAAIIETLAD